MRAAMQRDPMKTTLEPPLGSGPYRIKAGRAPAASIAYERVKDYWGKDLPVNRGPVELRRDPLRLLPRRDGRVRELQGRQSRLLARRRAPRTGRRPTTSPRCATASSSARRVPIERTQPMQCFVLNLRRPQFQDRRVRQAFNLAFDFEWANKNLFYGQYARVGSYLPGQRAGRAAGAAARAASSRS